jgi:hypothetical protein
MSSTQQWHLGMLEHGERTCAECDRRFNLRDDIDAEEWYYGHDCEVPA